MQKIFFILGIFTCVGLKAQTELFVVGGVNQSGMFVSPAGSETRNAGYSWQLGTTALFPIEGKGFLYAGLSYQTQKTDRTYTGCCVFHIEETYSPHYLNTQFGGGIQLPLSQLVRLKFSGGAYVAWATGGNVTGFDSGWDLPIAGAPRPGLVYYDRDIDFGGSQGDDMTRWNWGLQISSAIGWKKFELQFSYNHGISNLSPDKTQTNNGYLVTKYRSTQLNLAYRLFTFKK